MALSDETVITRFIGDNVDLARTVRGNRAILTGYAAQARNIAGTLARLSPIIFGAGGAAGLISFTQASEAIEKRLEELDALGGQFNTTIGGARELARAANEADIGIRDLLESGQQLAEGLVELREGGTGPQVKALERLSIAAKDLQAAFDIGGTEPLVVVFDALERLNKTDPAGALLALKQLFGEEQGRQFAGRIGDILEALNRSKGLGEKLAISPEAREALDSFTDATRDLSDTLSSVGDKAVAAGAQLAEAFGITDRIKALDQSLRDLSPESFVRGAARVVQGILQPLDLLRGLEFPDAARDVFSRLFARGSQLPDVLRQTSGGARGGFEVAPGTGTINGRDVSEIADNTGDANRINRQVLEQLRQQTNLIKNNTTGRQIVVTD